MKRLLLALLLLSALAWAQRPVFPTQIKAGDTDPATCDPASNPGERNLFWNTTTKVLKYCSATDTWSDFGSVAGSGTVINSATLTAGKCVIGNGTVNVTIDSGCAIAAGVITATGFAGPLTGNVTGNVSGSAGSATGNAATATKWATARALNGTNVDGTGNATIPVNVTDDNSTNADFFLTFVPTGAGNRQASITTTTRTFKFNPSTGVLTAPSFTGAGTGLTGTGASFTAGAAPFSGITGLPTTLAGYGITDAVGTATTFVGDVSGAYSATSVDKVKGKIVTWTSAAAGDAATFSDANNIVNTKLGVTTANVGGATETIQDAQCMTERIYSTTGATITLTDNLRTGCAVYLRGTGAAGIIIKTSSAWTLLVGDTSIAAATNFIVPAGSTARITTDATNTRYLVELFGQERVISWDIVATGDAKTYIPVYFACTIYAWDLTADASGNFTAEVDKKNAAIPNTTTDKVSGTGPVTMTGAQLSLDNAVANWAAGGTVVAPGDVLNLNTTTFTTVTHVHVQLRCH